MAKTITPLPQNLDPFGRPFFWEPIPAGGFRAWLADRSMCVGLTGQNQQAAMDAFGLFLPARLQPPVVQKPLTVCPRCGLEL